ncbi:MULTISPECIES: PEP-CTERM sorting domain-containing protein [unclassified Nostoc]|uniref:PEP-CTERM sorting domain-containing protein n=1 Tax=unclassified Nostoc TaxID=2593658 RepID=UPI00261D97CB|nr:PEP-CTERM sorting domain-containing protein [Nostoc sp. S13]MDF5738255.1 PEP-CTERM sorting domain-containing protein [Nostoc sp. S13]
MKSFFALATAQVATSLALCTTCIIASTNLAQAVNLTFDWKGDAGYSASGLFSYDETISPAIISESGGGATKALQSLSISFFNPSQELIVTKNEVANGVSNNQFFEFNFDTTTGNLFGAFDVGTGTGIGDVFLSNVEAPGRIFISPGATYYLYQNITADYSQLLDSSTNRIKISAVPESATVLGTLLVGMLGVALRNRTRAKASKY